MKKLEEVAHLYVGCKVRSENGTNNIWNLKGTTLNKEGDLILTGYFDDGMPVRTGVECEKPILRPLSDLTEEERAIIREIKLEAWRKLLNSEKIALETEAKATAYLLSRHFDLFGLIENNEAIDATTLNPNP